MAREQGAWWSCTRGCKKRVGGENPSGLQVARDLAVCSPAHFSAGLKCAPCLCTQRLSPASNVGKGWVSAQPHLLRAQQEGVDPGA